MLFNVSKNGCKLEERQLGTIERIERAQAPVVTVSFGSPNQ